MERKYTRPKTVRFTESTFHSIEVAAAAAGITTSEYIRTVVCGQLPSPEGFAS